VKGVVITKTKWRGSETESEVLGFTVARYVTDLYDKAGLPIVEMQWLMLQQDQPQDFVIATGIQYSVRTFVSLTAEKLGFEVEFSCPVRSP